MYARLFRYSNEYRETPFIHTIRFRTISKGKPSKYRIRVFGADKNGAPGKELIQEPLIFNSIKGKHNITVDIAKYRVRFPATGLFIGFEWPERIEKKSQRLGIYGRKIEDISTNWSNVKGEWRQTTPKSNSPYPLRIEFRIALGE